ncbi:MAG TPA: toxic anion resistance protein, partial [Sphingobium sp.]|nr:toxic anion resistance protein [Sphingobium sp.]
LENMKTTVNTLSNEVEKSKGYIARAQGQAQAAQEARIDNPLLSAIEG